MTPEGMMRAALCGQALAWAVAFALPGDTLAISHSLDLLRRLGSEGQWLTLFAVQSAVCLAGALSRSWLVRSVAAMSSAAVNLLLAVAALGNPIPSPGVGERLLGWLPLAGWTVWHEGRRAAPALRLWLSRR